MKLLLDSCVWGKAKEDLCQAGHDVVWAGEWEKDPGDQEILAHAYKEGRVLVTIDKDFGELAVVRRIRHSGIVRLVNFSAREQARACLSAISHYGGDLVQGAIVTVEAHRVRIRPPDNT